VNDRLINEYDGRPCRRCLTRSKRGARFCRNCGKRLPASSPSATIAMALAVAGIMSIFWLRVSRNASPMAATITPRPAIINIQTEVPPQDWPAIQHSAKLNHGTLWVTVYNGSNWAIDSMEVQVIAHPRLPSRVVQTYRLEGGQIRPLSSGKLWASVALGFDPLDDWTYRVVNISGTRVR